MSEAFWSNENFTNSPENSPNEIENLNTITSFDELAWSFENNESMSSFLDLIWDYIDLKLYKNNFSKKEISNIKLSILSEIQNSLNLSSIISSFTEKLIKPLKQLLADLELENQTNQENAIEPNLWKLNEIRAGFQNVFSWIGLDLKMNQIDQKIEKLNKEKADNPQTKFDTLVSVFTSINWDTQGRSEQEIFNSIKSEAQALAQKMSSARNIWEDLLSSIDKLPDWVWKTFIGFIESLLSSFPILWFIFKAIFWNEFLNDSNDKRQKANKNLLDFYSTENSPLKETKIKQEDLTNLNPKTLKTFYDFLWQQDIKIDYSREDFWENFLIIWKTKDEKIISLQNLIKQGDGSIFREDDEIDDFLNKLNSLEDKYRSKQNEISIQSQQEALTRIQEVNDTRDSVFRDLESLRSELELARENPNWTQDEGKIRESIDIKEQEIRDLEMQALQATEKKQEEEFRNSILNIKSIPTDIIYKWETLKLDTQNNHLVIWNWNGESKYEISIIYTGVSVPFFWPKKWENVFEKIGFGSNLELTYFGDRVETVENQKLIEILREILESESYDKDIEWKDGRLVLRKLN